jgi:hypothetical protein
MQEPAFPFQFPISSTERSAFLEEAMRTASAYRLTLGSPQGDTLSARDAAALKLLSDLDREIVEFSGYPDIIRLEANHFSKHGLSVPPRFADLSTRYRFYWIRFPTVLKPAPGTLFHQLECGVHFNPHTSQGHLLPRAALILPDRKFQQVLSGNMGLELHIDENFEFAASARLEEQPCAARAAGAAAVDLKAAANLGVVAGPFKYSWRRALVDHTAPGAERVFWKFSDASFASDDELAFVVVLQVPIEVKSLEIAGALRAYHRFNPAAALGEVFDYLGQRLREFFIAGAPTAGVPKVWDLSKSM